MQSSIKKSGWIIDHLKIVWCTVSLSSFTRFCLQDFSVRVVCNLYFFLQIEIVILIREA